MSSMIRKVLPLLLLLQAISGLHGLDFSFRPRGFMFIPLGEPSASRYTLGGGGDLALDVDLSGFLPNPLGIGYTAGIEGGLMAAPVASGAADPLTFYSVGGGIGFYYFPLSRILTRLDGALGVFVSTNGAGRSPASLWWRLGGEVGFRFTPNFILSVDGGYKGYTSNSGINGLYAGLALQINFETKAGDTGIDLSVVQETPVYPLYLGLYQENPAAALRLRNLESAEIRNVRISFRAGALTSSEFNCGTIPLIPKGQTVDVPLYADFAPALLNVTENGRILGEVIIRYSLLGKERETIRSAALDVYNRNIFPGGDWTGLAAFVSPTAPEVLEFSKYVTGLARTKRRTGINGNLQFAIYLFQGLLENRIRVKETLPDSFSTSDLLEVQYPFQTIAYRTGSILDVGLLYAGTLEAAGIKAAIIPLIPTAGTKDRGFSDDFMIAFSLGITESAAGGQFNGLDTLLVIDNEVWLPLSMTKFNDGFMESWKAGAEQLSAIFSAGESIDCIILEDTWSVYPPAPLPAQGIRINLPEQGAVNTAADAALTAYIRQEIQPRIAVVQEQIRRAPTAALYNQLGNLQTRAGNRAEAKNAFERAAGLGSVLGMVNRGNIALLEKDYTQAERWFTRALAAEPGNAAAARGLEQTKAGRELK